jgi:histidinol-phosphatase (PHP family)
VIFINIDVLKDGHIHSPFCPHGCSDSLKEYVEVGLNKGLKEITFTEHMPIPKGFMNQEFLDECAPNFDAFDEYIKEVIAIKKEYEDRIKINLGAEVDYIEGYEEELKEIIEIYGKVIEDSIISVHFVKFKDEYRCIDMLEDFEYLLNKLVGLEEVYNLYFSTLLKAIKVDLGEYKPKRIGHPTLVRKFCLKYPYEYKNRELIEEILTEIKTRDYEIDFNTSGLRKELCHEVYPSGFLMN